MAVHANFFSGKSEMEAILRLHNWEHSPLGSIDNWSQSLKTSLNTVSYTHLDVYKRQVQRTAEQYPKACPGCFNRS